MQEKSVMEIFGEIAKIPRCSGDTGAMRRYLADFAKACGYEVKTDAIGNVAAYAPGGAGVTLQSHYDIVCIGEAPKVEIVVEGGWMRARNGTLGADNGIGIAITLWLMGRGAPVDALFTNDEEIGLIGAAALELPIRTPNLLNLDSEELGRVYIGCAGGEDLYAQKSTTSMPAPEGAAWYRLQARAPGGHSGVNITDGIPNAISLLGAVIAKNPGMEIAWLEGGERINAIPRHAEALVCMAEGVPKLVEGVEAEPAEEVRSVVREGRRTALALHGFAHGVRAWNRRLDLPQSSVNLAKAAMDTNRCEIALSARAMADDTLDELVGSLASGWEACGFACEREGKYPAWKPEESDFAKKVLKIYKDFVPDASFAAIHAGLECALFAQRFPNLRIASIGPTILDPHSDRERVDMESLEKVAEVVARVVEDLSPL
ncbi:M20/M25/M40 family metallo-hydrolase [Hydrogenimonas sp.]